MTTNPALPRPPHAGVHERVVGGYRIGVRRVATAPGGARSGAADVLLVHGMVDTGATWAALWPGLAPHNVWVAELPWSGCDGVHWPHRMSATDWWRATLALCPVPPTVCVAHSFAASVLLDWALESPALPAPGLVLLAPFYCGAARPLCWSEVDAFARAVPERLAEGMRTRFARKPPPDSVLMAMARRLSQRCMPDALLELMRLFMKSRSSDLAQLSAPLLVACGDREGSLLRQSFFDLQRACEHSAGQRPAGAAFHELKGCGHHPMHEQPGRLLDLLGGFIHQLPAATVAAAQASSGRLACPAI